MSVKFFLRGSWFMLQIKSNWVALPWVFPQSGKTLKEAFFSLPAHAIKPVPAAKQLRVRPTFSKYLALNGRGLDVKQAFSPEGEFQRLAEQSGLYESDEL